MKRHRRTVAVAGTAALLCLVAAPAQAIPWPQGIPNQFGPNQSAGQVNIQVLNQTGSDVQFTFATNNDKDCPQNTYQNTAGTWTNGTSPALSPGQSGIVSLVSSECPGPAGGQIQPDHATGAFAFGLLGYSQFEFGVTWTFDGNFDYFNWDNSYTGGGNTGGMYMYNCGNNSLLASGNGGPTDAYHYANGTMMCFVVQDGLFDPGAL